MRSDWGKWGEATTHSKLTTKRMCVVGKANIKGWKWWWIQSFKNLSTHFCSKENLHQIFLADWGSMKKYFPVSQKTAYIGTSKACMEERLRLGETRKSRGENIEDRNPKDFLIELSSTKDPCISILGRELEMWRQISLCLGKVAKEYSWLWLIENPELHFWKKYCQLVQKKLKKPCFESRKDSLNSKPSPWTTISCFKNTKSWRKF